MTLRPLGDFLGQAIGRTGAKRSIDATVVVEACGPIIRQLLPELRPADFSVVSYRDSVLTIAVANPAIGQELQMRSEALLDVLHETFPDKPLSRLRFVPLIVPEEEFSAE